MPVCWLVLFAADTFLIVFPLLFPRSQICYFVVCLVCYVAFPWLLITGKQLELSWISRSFYGKAYYVPRRKAEVWQSSGQLEPGIWIRQGARSSRFQPSASTCILASSSQTRFLHNARHMAAGSFHALRCPISSPPESDFSSCHNVILRNLGKEL